MKSVLSLLQRPQTCINLHLKPNGNFIHQRMLHQGYRMPVSREELLKKVQDTYQRKVDTKSKAIKLHRNTLGVKPPLAAYEIIVHLRKLKDVEKLGEVLSILDHFQVKLDKSTHEEIIKTYLENQDPASAYIWTQLAMSRGIFPTADIMSPVVEHLKSQNDWDALDQLTQRRRQPVNKSSSSFRSTVDKTIAHLEYLRDTNVSIDSRLYAQSLQNVKNDPEAQKKITEYMLKDNINHFNVELNPFQKPDEAFEEIVQLSKMDNFNPENHVSNLIRILSVYATEPHKAERVIQFLKDHNIQPRTILLEYIVRHYTFGGAKMNEIMYWANKAERNSIPLSLKTYEDIIRACCVSKNKLAMSEVNSSLEKQLTWPQWRQKMIAAGLPITVPVYNSFLKMLCSSDKMDKLEQFLDTMKKNTSGPDANTYNILFQYYATKRDQPNMLHYMQQAEKYGYTKYGLRSVLETFHENTPECEEMIEFIMSVVKLPLDPKLAHLVLLKSTNPERWIQKMDGPRMRLSSPLVSTIISHYEKVQNQDEVAKWKNIGEHVKGTEERERGLRFGAK
ncbi:hypothetical protein PROFUN_09474 [Planoprotostelium fungivorum]|uniref:Pentatricopeptide repeat-containing protein n=1 Tax=Planoprotostelium fungivorum TaxID=1890364 RepID=A0A2P6NH58_9EUKA|nr:hypothetical protein PROFUN_09474 [Planoprotostelium fungivorum]